MTTKYIEWLKRQPSRRTVLKGVGAAIGVSALSGTGTAQSFPDENPNHGPNLTAHRGYVGVYPQNTLAAVEGASRIGVTDRIEIDVLPCADGEIVVFHDLFLDDLTNEEGKVPETPCETVLQAEVLKTGETIPTLAQTLDAARPSVTMNIEFKYSGNLSWEEFAERTLAIASEYPGDFYVSSFNADALRAVREVDPSVDIGVLFGKDTERNLEIARELDAEAVNPSLGVLDHELVETAHEHGRNVNVYTIGSWLEARRAVELNVDGLIADYPSVLEYLTSTDDGEIEETDDADDIYQGPGDDDDGDNVDADGDGAVDEDDEDKDDDDDSDGNNRDDDGDGAIDEDGDQTGDN